MIAAMPISNPKNAKRLMNEINDRCFMEKRYVRDSKKGMRIYNVFNFAGNDLKLDNSRKKYCCELYSELLCADLTYSPVFVNIHEATMSSKYIERICSNMENDFLSRTGNMISTRLLKFRGIQSAEDR